MHRVRAALAAAASRGHQDVRAIVPAWRFWRQIRISQPIRPTRLALYFALLILPFIFFYGFWQTTVALKVRGLVHEELVQYQGEVASILLAYQQQLFLLENATEETQYWVEQRTGLEGDAAIEAFGDQLATQAAAVELTLAAPPRINHSQLEAAIEAVFRPFAESSWGSIEIATPPGIVGGGTIVYPAPADLYEVFAQRTALGLTMGGWAGPPTGRPSNYDIGAAYLRWSLLWQGLGISYFLLLPLSLILVPTSLRRVKVRWPHIGRVFIYSAFIIPLGVFAGLLFIGISTRSNGSAGDMWRLAGLHVQHYGLPIVYVLWWAIAIRSYLMVPRGWLIAPLHALLIFLLLMAAIYLIFPDYMIEIDREVFPSWLLGM